MDERRLGNTQDKAHTIVGDSPPDQITNREDGPSNAVNPELAATLPGDVISSRLGDTQLDQRSEPTEKSRLRFIEPHHHMGD